MSELNVITGAGGFIGRYLSSRLLAEGFEGCWIRHFCRGTPDHIAAFSDHPRFFEQLGLSDRLTFPSAVIVGLHGEVTVWHTVNSDILAGVEVPNIDLRDPFLDVQRALDHARSSSAQTGVGFYLCRVRPMEVPLRAYLGSSCPDFHLLSDEAGGRRGDQRGR